MRIVLRRWSWWVATRATADVAGVCGAIGAAVGFPAGWFGTGHPDRLNTAATAGGAGAAVGGGLGLVIWMLCGVATRRRTPAHAHAVPATVPADQDLFGEFRALTRAQVRNQWRVLLDGRGRLDTSFTGYRRIAPPRTFQGSLRHRSDLLGALDAAAAPDGARPDC